MTRNEQATWTPEELWQHEQVNFSTGIWRTWWFRVSGT